MPIQHLRAEQIRAIESGRQLIQAANNSVTAMVNER